ncbi:hypothetical protein EZV73_09395 [Acidaminobacter sp. JC074]|uniref:AAA family ATPase n=1 Tax=Acidaminobacter sp. JC074 TaxID=2530199 RepID=UPI001F0D1A2B|nr:AAA family ATPase [Acidaminobacter sp. JC074]MCH4887788.1 hypothetical protein [Acidaminobacter sp. JC074]
MNQDKLNTISQKMTALYDFINKHYYEVEDFSLCILLSMISRTNMIALGQPGIAKSEILRTVVDAIDFTGSQGTPYFHVQMGSDISPNNVFGAPDIDYFKKHGIIKRHYKGFLPDAIIAFCSEFYRVNDQVANSGLLTILNEGEFKNGTDTVKTKLRFFMADTNFFPKQIDDLDVEETDIKLQALHDRFLSRVLVEPLKDPDNKLKMILQEDHQGPDVQISLEDITYIQDHLSEITLSQNIAKLMIDIAETLENKYHIFISPRRLKLSRNMVKAHALLNQRQYCITDDLKALQYTLWQKEEDIIHVKDLIIEKMDLPRIHAKQYEKLMDSIDEELERNINNQSEFFDFDIDKIYEQAIYNVVKLIEKIELEYPNFERYEDISNVKKHIELSYNRLSSERLALT